MVHVWYMYIGLAENKKTFNTESGRKKLYYIKVLLYNLYNITYIMLPKVFGMNTLYFESFVRLQLIILFATMK